MEIQNTKNGAKPYDLEDRTLCFAKDVRNLVQKLPKTISTIEDSKQLVRASGSVGANYIEANDSLSKKDLIMRIKICRKEAKECKYWLRLIHMDGSQEFTKQQENLLQESNELMNIFGAILKKIS